MTTMALTEPPLKRLFEKLDFAPQPAAARLNVVLKQWRIARVGTIAPRRAAIAFAPEDRSAEESLFIHRLEGREGDGVLTEGEGAAGLLLGACKVGDRLSRAANLRGAVRLRRLYAEVRRKGEPVLALFTASEGGRDHAIIELLAAPLSSDGKTVDSVLTAIAVQKLASAPPSRPARVRSDRDVALFALDSSMIFAREVAGRLGVELAELEDRQFEDGEYKIRPTESIRGRDVYVLSSLYGDASGAGADKLCKMLFFIGALRDAGAARVTAIAPYLCFARKDRRTKPRDPVMTRYVAQLFEAMGTDGVMGFEVHNVAAFQNAFRCETIHLDANALFARYFVAELGDAPVAVVSPDLGGEKRAELFRLRLERLLRRPVAKAFMDKYRSEGRVTGDIFAGDVKDRTAIILDDLIAGGGTIARTALACRAHGAARVWAAATHGVFTSAAASVLREAPIDRLAITDTVPLRPEMAALASEGRLTIVSVTSLVAEAIRRRHANGSITQLLEEGP
jgi:ribose-phosphate pyrophosphokinase